MQTSLKLGAVEIAAQLRRDISKGALRLHERLPAERRLAESFGVARGTLREALLQLEREGYVEIRRGSGTYVVSTPADAPAGEIHSANPLELIDARFALEPHICRLAVLHGRQSDFEKLESLCLNMEHSLDDPQGFSEADTAFHKLLADITGNRLLIWIIGQINSVRNLDEWTRMRRLTLNREQIALYNTQHRDILDALRTREPERAACLMKEHLEGARLSLTRAADT